MNELQSNFMKQQAKEEESVNKLELPDWTTYEKKAVSRLKQGNSFLGKKVYSTIFSLLFLLGV